MKIQISEQTKQNIIAFSISATIFAVVCFILLNLNHIFKTAGMLIEIAMPFVMGFAIAFFLSPIFKAIEKALFRHTKFKPKTVRKIAVAISMLIFFGVICFTLMLMIPQLISSIMMLSSQMEMYLDNLNHLSSEFFESMGIQANLYTIVIERSEALIEAILNFGKSYLPSVIDYSITFVSRLASFVIGLIIAIYMLFDKERFVVQAKKILYAALPQKSADSLVALGRLTANTFNDFIIGKLIDSLIIGIICYIGMRLLRLDYALLISVIVGITNIIPVFGPFIGAIPGILILLIVHPLDGLIFALFVLALQQFDGNILGPYILGDSVGLPVLWVMFAIIVGGGLFGFVGMFVGVPIMSVIYTIVKHLADERLKKKKLTIEA